MERQSSTFERPVDEIHENSRASFLQIWEKIFLVSCVFAVILDPLFLYVPLINQNMHCLESDRSLTIATLVLRTFTDLFYIIDIIVEVCGSPNFYRSFHQSYTILIDIVAILPFPQVLILKYFSKMRSIRLVINIFVLIQYLPRVFRIYLSSKEPRNSSRGETAIWVKGVMNFFMYILASHVLGAVWYFFAIERITVCWQYACRRENGCDTSTFACHERTLENTPLLKDLCPVSPPNVAVFDFGIFLGVLQSRIPSSTNFAQKISSCFCWGLRNLSSLGSNLQPSIDTWENLFVAFISITGLLLFIYLIGNLQTYMQLETARIEKHRHKVKIERKLEEFGHEIERWLHKNGIPERSNRETKLRIMESIRQELEENRDVHLNNILSILPVDLQSQIKSCMPLTRLKQVPMLQNIDEEVLKAICEYLKPRKYTAKSVIINGDSDSLEMMLFIVDGIVEIEGRGSNVLHRGARELYGEKLLAWPSLATFPEGLPSAGESVRALHDVEALVLMAKDMESVGSKFQSHFVTKYNKLKEKLANHLGFVESSLRIFGAEELKRATNNYEAKRIVGEGVYGTVYRGRLADNSAVAIKMCKISAPSQSDQFVDEVINLSQINHKNIVRLLGCCLEIEKPLMVYEFITNKTLYEHIHKKIKGLLSLELRIKIALESAQALTYLHSPTIRIIHQDVKTTNILLDDEYTAKVSDFGISRFDFEGERPQLTHLVQGTLGYIDPEYLLSNNLTEKSDVYSFGVVLVELITRKKAISFKGPENERNLASLFVSSMEKDCLNEILDMEVANEENIEAFRKVAGVAQRCLKPRGEERPLMNEVVEELKLVKRMMGKRLAGEKVDILTPKYMNGSADTIFSPKSNGTSSTGC